MTCLCQRNFADFCSLLRLPEVSKKDCSIFRNLSTDCNIDYLTAKTCTYKDLKIYEVFRLKKSFSNMKQALKCFWSPPTSMIGGTGWALVSTGT